MKKDDHRSGLIQKIAHASYYRQAIERLHKKLSAQSSLQLHAVQPEGFTFAQAYFGRKRLSRILAKSMASGEYVFSPAAIHDIMAGGKRRKIYSFSLTDRIVHGAVYLMLAEDFQKFVPADVYSYVKGRNRQQAIAALARYVRAHRRLHANPLDRGLYVLRCDIKSYGESISVCPQSALWERMDEVFTQAYGRGISAQERELLAQLVRPVLRHDDGGIYECRYGIPDGAPISALLLNLYARPLDAAFGEVQDGFYARYGDDIIFAHPDRDVFSVAEKKADAVLGGLGLERNETKSARYFFNGAGRPAHGFAGSPHVEYLGLSLGFDGTTSLKAEKLRELFCDLSVRVQATGNATRALPLEERGRTLCHLLNDALDPHMSDASPHAPVLRYLVNNRRQLRQIDYRLAKMVLYAVTRDASVKQFRLLPYRKIRQSWQLRSVEYARNH